MKKIAVFLVLAVICKNLRAQYTVNGNAQQISCNCYNLTAELTNQSGSVWNNNKIDLSQSFDFKFDINLGRFDANGADGIAFVLQPISTSVGSTGGGLGYDGITPAVGVTVDTYQNGNNNDPTYDHIAIQLNGDLNHGSVNNIAGPVQAIAGNDNIEDGNPHALRIKWDVATKTMSVYIDGVLRVSAIKDLVTDVFSGNSLVYWGFTGGTGSLVNLQSFCTALNPMFHFTPDQKRCINQPITFYDSTISFTTIAKFYWDFGDGSPIDSVNLNPVHIYTAPGDYIVKQRVVGADGCTATNTQAVRIGKKYTAHFTYTSANSNCTPMPPYNPITFYDSSYGGFGTVVSYDWDFFGSGFTPLGQIAPAYYTTPGDKTVAHKLTTLEGCDSDTTYSIIHMYAPPLIDFTFTDSVCLGSPMSFSGIVNATSDPIVLWRWNFTDGSPLDTTQNTSHVFTTPGNHNVLFTTSVTGTGYCIGLKQKTVFVVNKPTPYFKTTALCQSMAVTFTDSSYAIDGVPISQWWWDLGNGQFSTQQNPSTTYSNAGPVTIRLVVHNSRGCISDTLTQIINVEQQPIAKFGYSTPLCDGFPIQFSDSSTATGAIINQWRWINNGTVFSTQQNPTKAFSPGSQTVQLIAISDKGCKSDTAFKTFLVSPIPVVSMSFNNACKNKLVNFTATDNSGTVTQWKWTFGDGGIANTQNAQHSYTSNGTYPVKLYAIAANGCYSNSLQKDIIIYGTNVFAGIDSVAAAGQPIQLHATGGLSYTWTPATFLNDPNIANPIAIINSTQIFTVKAFTPQGCESYDDVKIEIYKGPDIYLPNAFTPNNDGTNDYFKGKPIGIDEFGYMKIYNRYGQEIFSTTDYRKGWDGKWKGQKMEAGVYVYIVRGIDFHGNEVFKKGTVMLIR